MGVNPTSIAELHFPEVIIDTALNLYQGTFSRVVGFAGKRFLFSPPPPLSTFFLLQL